MKKIFLLLTAVLTAGMLSAETIYGDCGPNMEWEFNTGSGALFLIGTGPMDDYTSSSVTPWAQYKEQIKSIQTDSRSQYTTIGDYAFAGCQNLTSVDLPNSVTKISGYAFDNCTGLTSVTIPNSVTSIGNYAFYGCSGLTALTIGEGVTSIGDHAFYNCTGLTSVTIPNSVTSIGNYAFYGCSGLTALTIGEGVTSIGDHAFYRCTGLTSVTIPNSVTSIGSYAFEKCTGLTSVYISDIAAWCAISFGNDGANPLSYAHNLYLNGELITDLVIPNSVTSIGDYAFWYCTGLTSVTIGNSVTSIGKNAFSRCSGLTALTIGEGVTSIGDHAFYRCTGLTTITCKAVNPPALGEDVFYNVNTTIPLYVPAQSVSAYLAAEQWKVFDVKEAQGIEGALPGVFTINANGDKVQFSQGNLQYQPSTKMLRFAENQWDFIGNNTIGNVYDGEIKCNNVNGFGASYTHWRDLFGWGTGDNPVKMTNNNSDFPSFTDWGINAITNGGNLPNLWRTLTKDEWNWLLFKRENASSLRGMVMIVYDGINSIQGLVLLPDDWATTFTPMTYSLNQWKQMEEHGAIFLPCAGSGYAGGANCFSGVSGINQNGDYWTASANEDEKAYHLHFARDQNKDVIDFWNSNRRYGCAVRPVRDVKANEGIEQPSSDSSLKGRANKVVRDGVLLIERNGKTYNAQGAEVR